MINPEERPVSRNIIIKRFQKSMIHSPPNLCKMLRPIQKRINKSVSEKKMLEVLHTFSDLHFLFEMSKPSLQDTRLAFAIKMTRDQLD